MLQFQKATVSIFPPWCNLYFDVMKVVLCKALFIIIKADSQYHMDQEWRPPGGIASHESKELQQDDSNPKSIF